MFAHSRLKELLGSRRPGLIHGCIFALKSPMAALEAPLANGTSPFLSD